MVSRILFLALFTITWSVVLAAMPHQDFCVANLSLPAHEGIYPCKDPKLVQVNDFSFHGLDIPGNTSNAIGGAFTRVFVPQLPALNTLGISFFRFDSAVGGIIPPHYHPWGSEIFTVLKGKVQVWFNTSAPENRQFTKTLGEGDVFVFPQGLVHYAKNIGKTEAVAVGGFSSPYPGLVLVKNGI